MHLADLKGNVAFVLPEYYLSERTACKLLDLEPVELSVWAAVDRNLELQREL